MHSVLTQGIASWIIRRWKICGKLIRSRLKDMEVTGVNTFHERKECIRSNYTNILDAILVVLINHGSEARLIPQLKMHGNEDMYVIK